MKKVLFLISCGWAVRNYITSKFIYKLQEFCEPIIFIPENTNSLAEKLKKDGFKLNFLKEFYFPYVLRFLNGALVIADNLRLGFWDPYLWNWYIALNPFWKRSYIFFQKIIGKFLSLNKSFYNFFQNYENKIIDSELKKLKYEILFDNSDLLVSTNPYSLYEFPISRIAYKNKIKTIGSIISWDNITYKGHLLSKFEKFLVWGPQMKKDLALFYPNYEEKIFEIGSLQFDFYFKKELILDKEYFLKYLNISQGKKIILYAGNIFNLFPDEVNLVEIYLKKISQNYNNIHLIVRVHPHDNTGRFEELSKKYENLTLQIPFEQNKERYWWFEPTLEDLKIFINTLKYCDLNINMCSSITLDCAIFNKPVINIAFTTNLKHPKARRLPHNYKSTHYKRIVEENAVKIAHNLDDLMKYTKFYLENPDEDKEGRKKIVEKICGPTDGNASIRLLKIIKDTL